MYSNTPDGTNTTTLYNITDPSVAWPSSGTNNYAALLGTACDAASSTSNNGTGTCDRQVVTGGTVSNFHVTLSTTPGSTATFTVMDNNVATAITCTITNPATTCADTSNSATFVVGHWVAVRYVRGSTSFTSNMAFTLDNGTATSGSASLLSGPHMTVGTVANVGTGGTAVTLHGSSVFTSNTSYYCSAVTTDAAVAVRVQQDSGTQITLSVAAGTHTVSYICVGTGP